MPDELLYYVNILIYSTFNQIHLTKERYSTIKYL